MNSIGGNVGLTSIEKLFVTFLLPAPKIVKRRDWKATQLVARDDAVFRRLIRDIKVVNGDDECDSKVNRRNCVEVCNTIWISRKAASNL